MACFSGKSFLCRHLTSCFSVNTIHVTPSDVGSKCVSATGDEFRCVVVVFSYWFVVWFCRFHGESEMKLISKFDEAISRSPSILVIDDVDILCPKRDVTRSDVDKRVSSTLLAELDRLVSTPHCLHNCVCLGEQGIRIFLFAGIFGVARLCFGDNKSQRSFRCRLAKTWSSRPWDRASRPYCKRPIRGVESFSRKPSYIPACVPSLHVDFEKCARTSTLWRHWWRGAICRQRCSWLRSIRPRRSLQRRYRCMSISQLQLNRVEFWTVQKGFAQHIWIHTV